MLPESEEKWNEPFGELWTGEEQAEVAEAGKRDWRSRVLGFGDTWWEIAGEEDGELV